MKELKRFKLTQLSNQELKAQEMNLIKGGAYYDCCGCGYGTVNRNANSSGGYAYSSGSNKDCWYWTYESSWSASKISAC